MTFREEKWEVTEFVGGLAEGKGKEAEVSVCIGAAQRQRGRGRVREARLRN